MRDGKARTPGFNSLNSRWQTISTPMRPVERSLTEGIAKRAVNPGTANLRSARRPSVTLITVFLLGVLGVGILPLAAQTPGLTEDEANTVQIFQEASRGVVHIEVRGLLDLGANNTPGVMIGTGFAIDHAGRILTAQHVIAGAGVIHVRLSSGRRLTAQVIGTSPQLDIALLQVKAPQNELFPLKLGDSSRLEVGQKVIAIGDPMGFDSTLTVGVVGALHRSLDGTAVDLQDALIQTDAAINPGNSGGPLLDSAGEVVGINNAKMPHAQGVGFAVPINFARRIIPDLIRMGHPYLPQLGFSGTEVTPAMATLFGLSLEHGFLVEEILPGSPAAEAGLRAGGRIVMVGAKSYVLGGDIITAVNGQDVTAGSEIAHALLDSRPGQSVRLSVYRQGQTREVSIRLSEMKMQF